MKILETISKDVDDMNDEAVRKWLKRYQTAMFLIRGKLHTTKFNPESISGYPQEVVDRLRIRFEALSELSTEIAKVMKEYKVAYTGDILHEEAKPVEDNWEDYKEYFMDRVKKVRK
ncbi:MAG: hypothetical protein DDT22_01371 [candidate division WS2 bacterium]|nr:hypothetical protein [Candidatus Lithacetigena glycinireducens]